LKSLFLSAAAALLLAACAGTPAEPPLAVATPPEPESAPAPTPPAQAAALDLSPAAVKARDEFLWLEEVEGERALAWVREQNARADAVLKGDPRYEGFRRDALEILTATDRIPQPSFRAGGHRQFLAGQDQRARAVATRQPEQLSRPDHPLGDGARH
jgi:prolyl oligopeptidase